MTTESVPEPSQFRRRAIRATLGLLFVVHCALRMVGVGWNIEAHSVFPAKSVPTYHIDELMLIESLRTDYRLFSDYSLKADGPLSLNLTYLPLRLAGDQPPERWDSARALRVGRWISVVSDCLAFPVLWLLLLSLGVSEGMALFGVAALLVLSPNNVFNAHFARSHMLAGLLQLATWLAALWALEASTRRGRAIWFGVSGFAAILAGSCRYPFLTLGMFPAAAGAWLLWTAFKRGELRKEATGLLIASAAAFVAGFGLGFDFRPVEILKIGFNFQQQVSQLPWSAVGDIVRGAAHKVLSTLQFPGGALRAALLLAVPLGFVAMPREARRRPTTIVAAMMAAWAVLYLALWAKFTVPWQRYSMPFTLAMGIAGVVGCDHLFRRMSARWPNGGLRVAAMAAGAVLLVPSARMSVTITDRFHDDRNNPHFLLSKELEKRHPRTVFIKNFWAWNRQALAELAPPDTKLRFTATKEEACRDAAPGDLLVDFAIEPFVGDCAGVTVEPAFHLSNVGPYGYPFPTGKNEPWPKRHYEDYHYLFEDIRGFVVQRSATEAAGRPQAVQAP